MILTPIPRERLEEALDYFMAGLADETARAVFGRIRLTSPDRAAGAEAEAASRRSARIGELLRHDDPP